jgi:hypothetical protein
MSTAHSGGALNAIPFWHCSFFDGNALLIDLQGRAIIARLC